MSNKSINLLNKMQRLNLILNKKNRKNKLIILNQSIKLKNFNQLKHNLY